MSFLLRNIRLLFLATLVLLTPFLKAQGIEDKLPAKFVRITTMEDITDDGYYLIGAIGRNKYLAYFLSSISTNNKLQAIYYGDSFEDIISEERTSNIWRFKHVEGKKYYIQTAVDNMNLYAGKKEKSTEKLNNAGPDIGISENVASSWLISINDDNTFYIANAEATDRFLSISEYDENSTIFGNYTKSRADSINLYIFKLATDFNQLPGNAVKPADGERLTVTTGDKLPTTKFTGENIETFQLHNGVIAPDDELACFTVVESGDDMFMLRSDNELFLQYDLKLSASETKWQIYNGHIATIEKTPRFLLYDNAENKFAIFGSTFNDIQYFPNISLVVFIPIGELPSHDTNAGVMKLSGSWSAKRLAGISLENISALDLSEISLPLHCNAFDSYPEDANIPIYVSEEDAEIVPETWNFVVAGDHLLRETTLYDRKPLEVPREIVFGNKQIKYVRRTLGGEGWETLCLPFNADVPNDYIFESLEDIADDKLIFKEVQSVTSDTPLIFARRAESKVEDICFEAKAGSLEKTESGSGEGFFGSYKRIVVGNDDENLYFLNADGMTFALASEGSGLSPFRGYIRLDKASNAPLYISHRATGISLPETSTNEKAFTIDGRRIDTHNADKGLYIIDGKKQIISKH